MMLIEAPPSHAVVLAVLIAMLAVGLGILLIDLFWGDRVPARKKRGCPQETHDACACYEERNDGMA